MKVTLKQKLTGATMPFKKLNELLSGDNKPTKLVEETIEDNNHSQAIKQHLDAILKEYNLTKHQQDIIKEHMEERTNYSISIKNKKLEEYFKKQNQLIFEFYDLLTNLNLLHYELKTKHFNTQDRLKVNSKIQEIKVNINKIADIYNKNTISIAKTALYNDDGPYLTREGLVFIDTVVHHNRY